MFIETDHNKYDLLEFFGAEPTNFADEDVGKYMYVKEANGIKIIFIMDIYDNTCSLCINCRNNFRLLFDYEMKDVAKVALENDKLKIYDTSNRVLLIVHKYPNIGVEL